MPISRLSLAALALCLAMGLLAACAAGHRPAPEPLPAAAAARQSEEAAHPAVGLTARGLAAWYGKPHHGKPTADGGRFDMNAYTAAHRTLPFGTVLKVTRVRNNKSVIVRVTDRGPYTKRFMIDLSRRAAQDLGMLRDGVAQVEIEIVSIPPRYKGNVSL